MDLRDALDEFETQENLSRNEGTTGVKNLCRIVHAMGYKDRQYFGQFHQAGSYGDLITFLEDNPGCVEAIKDWIAEQDAMEWAEELESHLDAKDEDED